MLICSLNVLSPKRYLEVYKPRNPAAAAGKNSGGKRRERGPICKLCVEAGLTGRVVKHKTSDCVERVRKSNLKKLADSSGRKRGREKAVNFSGSKKPENSKFKKFRKHAKSEEECDTCKTAGRSFRHSGKTCYYRPGGPWHGKTGEELRLTRKKVFDAKRKSKTSRSETNSAQQKLPLRKHIRGEETSPGKSWDANPPLWATLSLRNHVFDPETAIVLWNPKEN